MQIYFDDNLVPEDYYMSYSDNFSSFDESFYLGSSASLNATLQVPIVAWPGIINNVRIEVDGNPVATLKVDNITVNDDNSITLDLVDILTHTSTPCDFSALITYQKIYDPETDTWTETGTGITARQLLNFICQSYSITQGEFELTNGDVMIFSYDNSMTGRNYLEMIAELQGGYVHIDESGILYIKYYFREVNNEKTFDPDDNIVLSYDEVDTYKLSEEIIIERVVYDDGVTEPKKSSEDDSLYTLYLSTDNLFLQNIVQAEFNKICNNIIGYRFYNIHIDNCNRFFTPGSTIWFERESGERVPIIVNYTRDYVGGFVGSYETKVSGAKRTETEVIPTEDKIKRIRTILNQMDNSLTIQASKSDNLKTKTTQLRVDLEKVQSLFQITGGSNLIRNSQFLLPDETWTFTESAQDAYHTPIGSGYNSSLIGETVAVANIILRKSKARTEINNVKVNTTHNLNYYISQDSYTTTHVRLISKNAGNTIFDDVITTDSTHTITMRNYSHTIETTDSDYYFEIETTTTMSGYCKIYDLMFNSGDKKSWEPAASEVYSTILKMSQQGFQVYSSGSNILTLLTSDGFQVREAQSGGDGEIILGRIVSQFNTEGIITEIVRMTKAIIGTYIQEELTLNSVIHHVEYFEE